RVEDLDALGLLVLDEDGRVAARLDRVEQRLVELDAGLSQHVPALVVEGLPERAAPRDVVDLDDTHLRPLWRRLVSGKWPKGNSEPHERTAVSRAGGKAFASSRVVAGRTRGRRWRSLARAASLRRAPAIPSLTRSARARRVARRSPAAPRRRPGSR